MEIVLIVIAAVLILLLVGGFIARRRRTTDWSEHVAQADHHLEAARAADRGWDREVLLGTASQALESQRPGWAYEDLHLVLVDDKPGVEEDRAHFVALGSDGEARIVLHRDGAGAWHVDSVS